MEKRTYPSDLSDKEWQALEPLFRPSGRGRKRKWPIRKVLNAIFYVIKTGCQWRYLPADFPPWQFAQHPEGTVFYHFRRWKGRGRWFMAHEALRKSVRQKAGRHPHPSAAVLDSQSVKTTTEGACFRGFDGNKKVKGRKRQVLVEVEFPQAITSRDRKETRPQVDTLGLLLSIYTTPANVGDRWGAKACLGGKKYFLPRLKKIWANANYTGNDLAETCAHDGWELEIVKRPQRKFEVQPKRWIVERTLAWLLKYRRLTVDYERMPQTGESFTHIAMIRLMVRRLAARQKLAS